MKKDKIFPILIVLIAVVLRFLPHPANIAPIAAMALFGGAYLNKKYAIILPLVVMLISDYFLGFHKVMPFVYGSFLIASLIGMKLRGKVKSKRVLGGVLLSSIIFYVVTNFGVWLTSGMYEMNFLGLVRCYVLAIPFFRNTLVGDLFYTVMMFGGYEAMVKLSKKVEVKA
jgi:hypothetical protein